MEDKMIIGSISYNGGFLIVVKWFMNRNSVFLKQGLHDLLKITYEDYSQNAFKYHGQFIPALNSFKEDTYELFFRRYVDVYHFLNDFILPHITYMTLLGELECEMIDNFD